MGITLTVGAYNRVETYSPWLNEVFSSKYLSTMNHHRIYESNLTFTTPKSVFILQKKFGHLSTCQFPLGLPRPSSAHFLRRALSAIYVRRRQYKIMLGLQSWKSLPWKGDHQLPFGIRPATEGWPHEVMEAFKEENRVWMRQWIMKGLVGIAF